MATIRVTARKMDVPRVLERGPGEGEDIALFRDHEPRAIILELDSLYQFDGGDNNTQDQEGMSLSVSPEEVRRDDDVDRDSMAEVLLSSLSDEEH